MQTKLQEAERSRDRNISGKGLQKYRITQTHLSVRNKVILFLNLSRRENSHDRSIFHCNQDRFTLLLLYYYYFSFLLMQYRLCTVKPRFNEVPRDWANWFVFFRGLVITRFFSIHYALTGLENTVRYTEDFVIQRFVKSRFHCISQTIQVTDIILISSTFTR